MLFDYCSTCKRCCHIDPGYPPLEITLTVNEKKEYKSICIENECSHLTDAGCNLGEKKPFSCQMYPLVYEPNKKKFFYDVECPLMPEYINQLKLPNSEANNHLNFIKKRIKHIQQEDFNFLERTYAVDIEYFDIKTIPTN